MNNTLAQVVAILKKEGYTEDQIIKFTTDLSKIAFTKFYSEALLTLKDSDLKSIESCKTEKEANDEIRYWYKVRTGKKIEEDMVKFLEIFSQGFIEEYKKDKRIKILREKE